MSTTTETDVVARILWDADHTSESEALRTLLRTMAGHYRHDTEEAARVLNAEALRRGWCSEYEDVIDSMDLHLPWPPRSRTYDVTGSFTVRVTRQMRSQDQQGAIDSLSFGNWSSRDVANALLDGNCDWSYDDVEADETESDE